MSVRYTIRVVPLGSLFSFLDERREKGILLSALNLFMLGHLRSHSEFAAGAFFWCDGLMGRLFTRIKGNPVLQTRGVELTSALLRYWRGERVTVLGSLSCPGREVIEDAGLTIHAHHPMPELDIQAMSSLTLAIETRVVLITLPSPKQELLAQRLALTAPNSHYYCIGGALNMMAHPELDCPAWMHRCGLEFLFRLRSDTRRRLARLWSSSVAALCNVSGLARSELLVCRPE